MKRIIVLMSVLLPFVAGCDMKDVDQVLQSDTRAEALSNKQDVVLSAYVADGSTDTKTSYNWSTNKILWTPGDKISLFYGSGTNGGECFTSTNTESTNKANFSGKISVVTGITEQSEEVQFWGIYPYNTQNVCEGSSVTVRVQHEQTAVDETFAEGQFISIGRSPGLSMGFYNLCASFYVKFTRSDIVSVKLRGKSGQTLAGQVKVGMNDSGRPEVTEVLDGETEVTLSRPGGSPFTPGVGYYIVHLPAHFTDGFEFEMTTESGYTGIKSYNIDFTQARNDFQGFSKTLDDGVEFTKEGNIVFADANVKAICVSNWDTNADGELSYTEAAAVTGVFPYDVFGDNTTITSFDEFQYFTGVTSLGYTTDGRYDEGYDYIGAFSGCSALKSIVLPSSLTDIGIEAFSFCTALETITIPATVTRIGMSAFSGCTNLVVTMESETPCTLYADSYWSCGQGVTDAFGGYQTRVKVILVPTDESVTAYQNAQYWSDYAFIIRKVGWVDPASLISFKDGLVKLYCVDKWDTNGDGELSMSEAAAVTNIGTTFKNTKIISFDELVYFTGLTTIPSEAFYYCDLLESISFPSSITSIYNGTVFYGDKRLKKITVPNIGFWFDVLSKTTPFYYSGGGALYINNDLLTHYEVPESMTEIPSNMFAGLAELKSVVLPSGLTIIGDGAFADCTSLPGIDIPSSVNTIRHNAFRNCSSITSITIPESVTNIGTGVFLGCSGLQSINIPECWTSIPMNCFNGCSELKDVVLPSGLTTIASAAFAGCISLTSISLPNGLTKIGGSGSGGAFEGSGLTDICIPETVNTIGEQAFANCIHLSNIVIPEGVETIGGRAFDGCTILKSISLPQSVTSVNSKIYETNYGAFYGSSITTIEIYNDFPLGSAFIRSGSNNSSTTITTVTKVIINKKGTTYSLGSGKFKGMSSLRVVILPEGLIELELQTFSGCTSLKSVSLPSSLRQIGANAFDGAGLTSIDIPSGVREVRGEAFYNCSKLESISLPDELSSIGKSTFSFCTSLTNIVIPSGVVSVGNSAFYNCTKLNSVHVEALKPPVGGTKMFSWQSGASVFHSGCPIYVPAGSVDTYKAAANWSAYASRIQAIPAE